MRDEVRRAGPGSANRRVDTVARAGLRSAPAMPAPDLARFFASQQRAHERWRERAEKRIASWEWASGPLVGRSTVPFADYDADAAWGRTHGQEPARKTSHTVGYGLAADGAVVICRAHGPVTSYVEEIAHPRDGGVARARYRHDGALLEVSFASYEDGKLVRFQCRDWQSNTTDYVLTYRHGRVARMVQTTATPDYKERRSFEMQWNDAGLLAVLTVRYGPKGKPEPVFQRTSCPSTFLKRLEAAGL